MDEPKDLQHESVNDLFDGDTISPQFAIALKAFLQQNKLSNVKSGTIAAPGGTSFANFAIPHGLSGKPNLVPPPDCFPGGTGTPPIFEVWIGTTPPDATNIYVSGFGTGSPFTIYWSAAII